MPQLHPQQRRLSVWGSGFIFSGCVGQKISQKSCLGAWVSDLRCIEALARPERFLSHLPDQSSNVEGLTSYCLRVEGGSGFMVRTSVTVGAAISNMHCQAGKDWCAKMPQFRCTRQSHYTLQPEPRLSGLGYRV